MGKLLAIVGALSMASPALAHNAGTDKVACHVDNDKVGFHCHATCTTLNDYPVGIGEVAGRPVQASPPLIYATQVLLQKIGIDVGDADGIFGPRTHAGVEAFQSGAGLPVDGQIDERLIAQLASIGQCTGRD